MLRRGESALVLFRLLPLAGNQHVFRSLDSFQRVSKVANRNFYSLVMGKEHVNTKRATTGVQVPVRNKSAVQGGYVTDLPKLGVPKLEDTVSKLVHLSKPVLSPQEYNETLKQAEEFLKSNDTLTLQDLLLKRAKRLPNWLTPWWLNKAYLAGRTPLPIVTSPGITFERFPFKGEDGQVEYAAKIIQAFLQYREKIAKKELKQDGSVKAPFDMGQYDNLFGTTRIPHKDVDEIRYGKDNTSNAFHILVVRNGHSFRFPVFSKNGEILGLNQIVTALKKYVIPQSQERNPYPINLMSADDRDTWAEVYQRLKHSNATEIAMYEDALFVLSLDKTVKPFAGYDEQDALMLNAIHGCGSKNNAINRWFDKTLQVFPDLDGGIATCYEHTPAEGPPLANLLDFSHTQIKANAFVENTVEAAQQPVKLNFRLTELDRHALELSIPKTDANAADVEVKSLHFTDFGKNVPKRARFSPDSFIQLAFQVAFYRLHGTHPPTYETATLRQFLDGRTDTIRLPNQQSAAFVEAFAGDVKRVPDADLAELLTEAINAHKKYSVAAMSGQGMDRHILGLKLIAAENNLPLPSLLQGKALQRLLHFQVSTSQVPSEHEVKMGFGPSETDCYGVCYNPRESSLFFTFSAFNSCPHTSAKQFAEGVSRALNDMRSLLEKTGRVTSKL